MKKDNYILQYKGLMSMDDNEIKKYNAVKRDIIDNFKKCFPEFVSVFLINRYNSTKNNAQKKQLFHLNDLINNRKLTSKDYISIIDNIMPDHMDDEILDVMSKEISSKKNSYAANLQRSYIDSTF